MAPVRVLRNSIFGFPVFSFSFVDDESYNNFIKSRCELEALSVVNGETGAEWDGCGEAEEAGVDSVGARSSSRYLKV